MTHRYARIEQISAIGEQGLARLRRARVAVIGVGNIGGEAARHLAMLGAGLILIDCDRVKEENLGTQGFTPDQLRLSKVEARRRTLAALNPDSRITAINERIERLGLGALRQSDLILCCLDSRRARAVVSEVAAQLAIPWIDAAIDGSGKSFLGRVAAYDPRLEDSPCYLCQHDQKSLAEMMSEGKAAGCPSWKWKETEVTQPTLAVSALGAVVASVQVIWGLKFLLGRGDEIAGSEAYFDLDRARLAAHRLRRNPKCVFDHCAFRLFPIGRSVSEMTVSETFAFAEERLGLGVTLQLHRRSIATEIACPRCNSIKPVLRTIDAINEEQALCRCGELMQPMASRLLDRFGCDEAEQFLFRKWEEIGLPAGDVVTASNRRGELHLLFA